MPSRLTCSLLVSPRVVWAPASAMPLSSGPKMVMPLALPIADSLKVAPPPPPATGSTPASESLRAKPLPVSSAATAEALPTDDRAAGRSSSSSRSIAPADAAGPALVPGPLSARLIAPALAPALSAKPIGPPVSLRFTSSPAPISPAKPSTCEPLYIRFCPSRYSVRRPSLTRSFRPPSSVLRAL